jgi:protein-disulfide isomerase
VEVVYETPQELIALAQGVHTGNPDADVTVIEFADYQCPSCRNFFQQAKPFLDLTYIESGQIRFTFYDFPLVNAHPNAFLAARAARCAGDQSSYWAFHDRLFQMQAEWSGLADPSGRFREYAAGIGLEGGAFASCLASDRHAEVVSANMILGLELGVQGTPTVLIDTGEGRAVAVQDWGIDNIRSVVDGALARAGGASGEAGP